MIKNEMIKDRRCLKCNKMFPSHSPGHRYCGKCRSILTTNYSPPPSRQGRVIKKLGGMVKDGFGDRSDE